MRTVIYARFSSALQNARSIEDQVALCRERIAREGWEEVGVFTDYAISGAAGIDESARPGLNAMLARVESGGVDQILAEATDRIARHQGDAFAIRERVLFAGARIFTLSDGEVTEITATFRGLMDAQFRKDLGAKVKRGQRGTIASGRSAAGIAYGYRTANRIDDRGKLVRGLRVIDEDQADVVRRIFAEYIAGASPRAIAEGLNNDGMPSPGGRLAGPSFWRASTIYGDRKRRNGILQNRLYIGELVFNRTRKVVDPRTRKPVIVAQPESEWIVEPAPQLRIVDEATWAAAQAMLESGQAKRPELSRRPKHMLSGIACCGTCGGAWTIRGPDRWGCSRNKEGGAAACANGRTISTKKMEARVLNGLTEQMLDPEAVEIYVREYHREHARRAGDLGREGEKLRKRHRELATKVERLVAAIADGGADFVEIREAMAKAKTERDQLADQIDQLEQLPVIALHPTIARDYRQEVMRLNETLAANPAARAEVFPRIRALVESIVISPAAEPDRGVTIAVTGRLNAMLALAAGQPMSELYGNAGAGEGIRTLDPNLGKVVLYP
ncbi:recombinase family protein [Novosphingobium olei]|nr:recombinase family protein [Novosphingobium olei]